MSDPTTSKYIVRALHHLKIRQDSPPYPLNRFVLNWDGENGKIFTSLGFWKYHLSFPKVIDPEDISAMTIAKLSRKIVDSFRSPMALLELCEFLLYKKRMGLQQVLKIWATLSPKLRVPGLQPDFFLRTFTPSILPEDYDHLHSSNLPVKIPLLELYFSYLRKKFRKNRKSKIFPGSSRALISDCPEQGVHYLTISMTHLDQLPKNNLVLFPYVSSSRNPKTKEYNTVPHVILVMCCTSSHTLRIYDPDSQNEGCINRRYEEDVGVFVKLFNDVGVDSCRKWEMGDPLLGIRQREMECIPSVCIVAEGILKHGIGWVKDTELEQRKFDKFRRKMGRKISRFISKSGKNKDNFDN